MQNTWLGQGFHFFARSKILLAVLVDHIRFIMVLAS